VWPNARVLTDYFHVLNLYSDALPASHSNRSECHLGLTLYCVHAFLTVVISHLAPPHGQWDNRVTMPLQFLQQKSSCYISRRQACAMQRSSWPTLATPSASRLRRTTRSSSRTGWNKGDFHPVTPLSPPTVTSTPRQMAAGGRAGRATNGAWHRCQFCSLVSPCNRFHCAAIEPSWNGACSAPSATIHYPIVKQ
jgi:hypothetical protein